MVLFDLCPSLTASQPTGLPWRNKEKKTKTRVVIKVLNKMQLAVGARCKSSMGFLLLIAPWLFAYSRADHRGRRQDYWRCSAFCLANLDGEGRESRKLFCGLWWKLKQRLTLPVLLIYELYCQFQLLVYCVCTLTNVVTQINHVISP